MGPYRMRSQIRPLGGDHSWSSCCDVQLYYSVSQTFEFHGLLLTLTVLQMEPNGPVRVHLVPFVTLSELQTCMGQIRAPHPENLGQDLEGICRIVHRSKWVNP